MGRDIRNGSVEHVFYKGAVTAVCASTYKDQFAAFTDLLSRSFVSILDYASPRRLYPATEAADALTYVSVFRYHMKFGILF
jgi:hypothetical protein